MVFFRISYTLEKLSHGVLKALQMNDCTSAQQIYVQEIVGIA